MPTDDIPLVDARVLRTWAEFADGTRDTPFALVLYKDEHGVSKAAMMKEGDLEASSTPSPRKVLRVSTASEPGPRKDVTVGVKLRDSDIVIQTPSRTDAVFATQSAVEKFLWPYYEGMRIFEPEYLAKLKGAYYHRDFGARILGFTHVPPSQSGAMVDPSTDHRALYAGPEKDGAVELIPVAEVVSIYLAFLSQST